MRASQVVRLLMFAVWLFGCATTNVTPTAPFKQSAAYLYGRFTIHGQAMAFVIRCRDGTTYRIVFSSDDEVQMIEVVPSVCQLDDVSYGAKDARLMASFRLLRNEVLDPGGVYYVGDFAASGTSTVAFRVFYNEVHETWRMNGMRDNYLRTTAEMKRAFPAFSAAATEDRMTH